MKSFVDTAEDRSHGTACAKPSRLIVLVVGAEIELDKGPISFARE